MDLVSQLHINTDELTARVADLEDLLDDMAERVEGLEVAVDELQRREVTEVEEDEDE